MSAIDTGRVGQASTRAYDTVDCKPHSFAAGDFMSLVVKEIVVGAQMPLAAKRWLQCAQGSLDTR